MSAYSHGSVTHQRNIVIKPLAQNIVRSRVLDVAAKHRDDGFLVNSLLRCKQSSGPKLGSNCICPNLACQWQPGTFITHRSGRRHLGPVQREAINTRLTTNYQLSSAKALPTPIDASSSNSALSTSKYGVSAAVNGGFVKAANFYNPSITSPGLTLATDLGRDFTDGRIDGFTLDGTQVAPATAVSYESTRLPLGGKIGTDAITAKFGAPTLFTGPLVINEESSVGVFSGLDALYSTPDNLPTGYLPCDGFNDEAALMSDGSVSLVRHFPTVTSQGCKYLYDAAEFARDITIKNFLTDVKYLSRGGNVGYAVKSDGTVMGWGDNYCGRLSPALPNGRYQQAVVIPQIRDLTSVDGDAITMIGRDKLGNIYTWGPGAQNTDPESAFACGTGSYAAKGVLFFYKQSNKVNQVTGFTDAVAVHASSTNYFLLTSSGDLYGWGGGWAGLLANSGGAQAPESSGMASLGGPSVATPTKIPGLKNVRKLVLVGHTAFALQADGTVKAWGSDQRKLLGNGKQLLTALPTTVPGLTNIANIEGDWGSLRLQKDDGTVLVWGNSGWLYKNGVQDPDPYYSPTVFVPPEKIRHIASRAGGYSVFYASGKVWRDVDRAFDVTPKFR